MTAATLQMIRHPVAPEVVQVVVPALGAASCVARVNERYGAGTLVLTAAARGVVDKRQVRAFLTAEGIL